jgi:superfamily I DNA/RNA helicase
VSGFCTIINELMIRNVKELKEKLSSKKDKIIISEFKESNSAQRDLLNELKESSSN